MVGHVAEQKELRSLLEEPESVFAAVYGRRRVGKTYLVRKTFGNDFAFDHVGMSSGKMSDQLESFRNSLVANGHRKCPELKSWIGAFEELKRLLERNKSAKKDVESIKHKRTAFCFATGTKRAVHLTVVTTDGLVHNSYRNEIQKELTLNDLFVS